MPSASQRLASLDDAGESIGLGGVDGGRKKDLICRPGARGMLPRGKRSHALIMTKVVQDVS